MSSNKPKRLSNNAENLTAIRAGLSEIRNKIPPPFDFTPWFTQVRDMVILAGLAASPSAQGGVAEEAARNLTILARRYRLISRETG